MAIQHVSWISIMGAPEVNIDADFDEATKTVTVDAATLMKMASGWLAAGILDCEDDAKQARFLLDLPAREDGRYDVTEVGGDWNQWNDSIIEPEAFVAEVRVTFGDGSYFRIEADGPEDQQGTTFNMPSDPDARKRAHQLENDILEAILNRGFNPAR